MIKAMAAGVGCNDLIFFIVASCLEYRDGLSIQPPDLPSIAKHVIHLLRPLLAW